MKKQTIQAKYLTPCLPNFIRLSAGGSIDVKDLTEEELRSIAATWTQELIENARRRRK